MPEATQLPITFLPILLSNSSIISLGNPFGKVLRGVVVKTPAISKCPVIVSLPRDNSLHTPTDAICPPSAAQI